VRLYPGQAGSGQWHRYTLRFDNQAMQLSVNHGHTTSTVPLPCPVQSDHAFTLKTGDGPLFIELRPSPGGRTRLCAEPGRESWSHSLMIAGGLGILAVVIGGPVAGIIAGGACLLHCFADRLGFSGSVPLLFPLIRERSPGYQLILPSRAAAFNVSVIWLSLLLVAWNGIRGALPDSSVPSLISFLLLGGALPLTLAWWIIRKLETLISSRSGR
jgi:hypothetical protein